MDTLVAARRLLLACLLGAAPAAQAQAPDTLRLDAVLDAVVAANPALRAARLDARALAERGDQVGARPDPTASVMVLPYPLVTERGLQRSQWTVEQMVPWPGTLGLRRAAADASAEAARYDADALALDLAREAALAFVALVRVQRTEAVVRSFQARLDAFAEAAAVRYEVGRGPQGAILQVQLERQRLAERLLDLARQREAAVRTLARLLDRPGLVLGPVVAEPPPRPEAARDLVALALRLRPELRAAEAGERGAEAEVALAEADFNPEVGVGVTFMDMTGGMMEDMGPAERVASGLGVMVSARIPLDRGRLRAGLEEARLRRAAAEARREAAETEVRARLADLLYAAEREAEAVALYERTLLPQAETTVESAIAGYTTGEVDFLAFLDAERMRFDILLGYEDARARHLDALAELARALGVPSLDALPAATAAPAPPDR